MKRTPFVILFFLLLLSLSYLLSIPPLHGQTGLKEKIINNESLLVPGLGSNGIVLGESINTVTHRIEMGTFKISRPRHESELFMRVFKVACKIKIIFDAIYYNQKRGCAVFVFQGIVVAVAGFNNNHITDHDVSLQKGISSFIFTYGNKNLNLVRNGNNGIYLYPEIGIAVADDEMNDTVDLFVVFTPQLGNKEKL